MMNLLALDASTEIASVALMTGGELLLKEQPTPKTHAQLILPLIDSLLLQSGLHLSQLDALVFGCGPGSFTGLRIACSIAKALAYAQDLPLIPVSSLSAIAYSVQAQQEQARSVLAAVDARMQELYWGYFPRGSYFASEKVNTIQDVQLPKGEQVLFAGVGVETYWSAASPAWQKQILKKITCYPSAASMIQLAVLTGIKSVSAADAQPTYIRNKVTQGASGG